MSSKTKKSYYKPVEKIKGSDRRAIRLNILSNYHNYTEFCKDHSQFDCVYISNVVSGKLKLKSKKYNDLIQVLKEYNNLKLK
jgi:hypothetical protein